MAYSNSIAYETTYVTKYFNSKGIEVSKYSYDKLPNISFVTYVPLRVIVQSSILESKFVYKENGYLLEHTIFVDAFAQKITQVAKHYTDSEFFDHVVKSEYKSYI